MPFCPECKCEYVPGITTCPDCGVKLVEKQPQEKQADWVCVGEYPSLIAAEMAKLRLGSCEIAGVLCDGLMEGMYAGVGTMRLESVRLMVHKDEAPKALEILESKE